MAMLDPAQYDNAKSILQSLVTSVDTEVSDVETVVDNRLSIDQAEPMNEAPISMPDDSLELSEEQLSEPKIQAEPENNILSDPPVPEITPPVPIQVVIPDPSLDSSELQSQPAPELPTSDTLEVPVVPAFEVAPLQSPQIPVVPSEKFLSAPDDTPQLPATEFIDQTTDTTIDKPATLETVEVTEADINEIDLDKDFQIIDDNYVQQLVQELNQENKTYLTELKERFKQEDRDADPLENEVQELIAFSQV